MRTSLNDIRDIEGYLLGTSSVEQRLLLEARAQVNADLAENITLQSKAFEQIRLYSQNQLRQEIKVAETEVFTQSKYQYFRQKVLALFKT